MQTNTKINTPVAIIVAGLLIAIAIVATQGGTMKSKTKSFVEEIGIDAKKMQACIDAGTYKDKVQADTESGDRAMAHMKDGRGTPYNVLVSKSGIKVEVAGALPYEAFKQTIDSMLAGTAKDAPLIQLDPVTKDDHVIGSPDAEITIVEYTDLECPFCARVHPTLHQLVTEYNGKVNWVIRHYPLDNLHENARAKAEASECVWEQGGDEAFIKYVDHLFELIMPKKPTFDATAL